MSTVQLPSDEVYLVGLVACRCINETMNQQPMVDVCDTCSVVTVDLLIDNSIDQ